MGLAEFFDRRHRARIVSLASARRIVMWVGVVAHPISAPERKLGVKDSSSDSHYVAYSSVIGSLLL
jgi:hypothetical protein